MSLAAIRPRRTHFPCVLAAALVGVVGCLGPPPPPERPTPERVSVSARSIGIPYGPVVLLRNREQLVAVRVVGTAAGGYSIEYRWETAPFAASGFATEERGTGMTQEERGHGVVKAGPLRFKWSRGSQSTGWLYWPPASDELSVCSVTWPSIEEIDLQDPEIYWYTQEMFK